MKGEDALTTDSIVHQSAAGIFFAGAIVHMGCWLRLVTTVDARCALARRRAPLSFCLKAAAFVFSFVPLPAAFMLHPASPVRARLGLSEADAGGIQQYMLVLCVATFFASYTIELRTFARLAEAGASRSAKTE